MCGYALHLTFETSVLVLLSVKRWSRLKRDGQVRLAVGALEVEVVTGNLWQNYGLKFEEKKKR